MEYGVHRFPELDYPHLELTGRIIAAFFQVYNVLGFGLLESVYRRALAVELDFQGIRSAHEVRYEVVYRGVSVGSYRADLVVEAAVIVETKTGTVSDPTAPAQLLNCLKASGLPIGLVLHFGIRPEIRRVVASDCQIEKLG